MQFIRLAPYSDFKLKISIACELVILNFSLLKVCKRKIVARARHKSVGVCIHPAFKVAVSFSE